MMIYKNICIPLMQINSNIYGFFSGIFVSLAVEIFSSLIFEKFNFFFLAQWHLFLATLFFTILGAICIWISVKVIPFQSYINVKQIFEKSKRVQIIIDATQSEIKKWIFNYLSLFIILLAGIGLLILNWFLN